MLRYIREHVTDPLGVLRLRTTSQQACLRCLYGFKEGRESAHCIGMKAVGVWHNTFELPLTFWQESDTFVSRILLP